MLEWCYSSTSPAHLQHKPAPRQHAPSSELLERVGSVPTPLQHHTSTTSTRHRVTIGAAHTTSRDPKVKIRSGHRAKTRFQAGFAILTSFSKANSYFSAVFHAFLDGFGDRWRGPRPRSCWSVLGKCRFRLEWCWSGAVPALVQHAPVLC